jgi:hypothetical protein
LRSAIPRLRVFFCGCTPKSNFNDASASFGAFADAGEGAAAGDGAGAGAAAGTAEGDGSAAGFGASVAGAAGADAAGAGAAACAGFFDPPLSEPEAFSAELEHAEVKTAAARRTAILSPCCFIWR